MPFSNNDIDDNVVCWECDKPFKPGFQNHETRDSFDCIAIDRDSGIFKHFLCLNIMELKTWYSNHAFWARVSDNAKCICGKTAKEHTDHGTIQDFCTGYLRPEEKIIIEQLEKESNDAS
jgi:hypothetical protein